jgi:4-diphosphocytidyl-2-C-methyl-D-erythritol kinase
MRMRGIGEDVAAVPALPDAGLVLVNPGVSVPTPAVFQALHDRNNPPMPEIPGGMAFDDLVRWLWATRNDLQHPAELIAPPVGEALRALRASPDVAHAVMSGSGATCVGVTPDLGGAERTAARIAAAQPSWWVVAARLLS